VCVCSCHNDREYTATCTDDVRLSILLRSKDVCMCMCTYMCVCVHARLFVCVRVCIHRNGQECTTNCTRGF